MNKLFLIAIIGTFLYAQKTLLPESTVAVVNGTAISVDERDKEVGKLLPKEYFHTNVNEEKLKGLREKALESLIEKTLLYNYAISKKIKVTDSEVDEVMTNLAATYGSKKDLEEGIKGAGFTKVSFREAVKKDEVLKKLYIKEIEANLSDAELKKYYDKNMYKFKEPEKLRVRLIYVKNDPTVADGKQKAKKKIEEAQALLKKGENFPYVAQTYSNDASRVMGGDMGYLHKGMLDSAVEERALSMQVGAVSEIIEKDIGFFIVKVEEKAPANQLSFEAVKNGLRKELKEKEEDRRKAELLDRLKLNSVIVK
ncbi:MAG: peptidylprolyl isomerase [Sulfurimonas sp.]